ncbi:hypothetical protein J8M21_20740 [Pseudoalteromonas luteoviolacea]|uniref:hypothetical protein n=1 Tax=Pseudoalteromonas luteoviolacea TaxID=43657 RepID=UPI001B39E796|nr:hypothetical protein [Pseudoalteromonas luteoviolacea]MBQ4879649.1 hypothetical protein [Pseudoalteromonas luteoviolacea]MBQ4908677.1 hypothetical protein [Pseudoalteromonas luteoviolacea]
MAQSKKPTAWWQTLVPKSIKWSRQWSTLILIELANECYSGWLIEILQNAVGEGVQLGLELLCLTGLF